VDLSVVIVNWNCSAYTRACAASLLDTMHGLEYEIVVVDNASSDDSAEVLARCHPRVRLVISPCNGGFARGNNLGVQVAAGRHLLFLNPDTLVLDDAVRRMLAALRSSPDIGAVGCRLLNADRTLQATCVQRFPTILNQVLDADCLKRRYPSLRLWGAAPLFTPATSPVDVEMVSGACLMTSRAVFERVGGFSTEYFLYAEDVDLCWKIRRTGLRVCHVPDAEVVHYGGGSSAKSSDGFSEVVMRESIHRFLQKTRGARYASAYRIAMRAAAALRILLLRSATLVSKDPASLSPSLRKWRRVLSWSRGHEAWAERLGAPRPEAIGV
jgi:GT2 family glycosyltransferase